MSVQFLSSCSLVSFIGEFCSFAQISFNCDNYAWFLLVEQLAVMHVSTW